MGKHLLLTVRLHADRYHGLASEWPPSPARLFQALVAGAARGARLDAEAFGALRWLETLPPPVIAAPRARRGQRIGTYVPNNDADASKVLGDPSKVGDIRVEKLVEPHWLEGDPTFGYAWPVDSAGEQVPRAQDLAAGLYQFGRGVDMAWAVAEVLDDRSLWQRLVQHSGTVHEPHGDDAAAALPCPTEGTLQSLIRRFGAPRLRVEGKGKHAVVLFSNPPKPVFVPVSYRRTPPHLLFELRRRGADGAMCPWPLSAVASLIERLRDGAEARLCRALPPERASDVARVLRGLEPDQGKRRLPSERAQLIALPSIGHEHADRSVRRFVLRLGAPGSIATEDLAWAFSGLETLDPKTGELDAFLVTPASERRMLAHYVGPARVWRSVTPVVLPKRKVEVPAGPAGGSRERCQAETRAIDALGQSLRHAGVRARILRAQVRREPFEAHGDPAGRFAVGTRFEKERLWHVELTFDEAIEGPLVLGDGRFLGLGLMAPVSDQTLGVHAFHIVDGLIHDPAVEALTRALRRAVMARAQRVLGEGAKLPAFFCGHGAAGGPAQREVEPHLTFAFDREDRRLLVLAPHVCDHRAVRKGERKHLRTLDEALAGFTELRAGEAGRLRLIRREVCEGDAVLAACRAWQSVTPYVVTRHSKVADAVEALAVDVRAECRRAGLPEPEVEATDVRGVAGVGLTGHVRLRFAVAVPGPVVLGRDRYLGGGLFRGVGMSAARGRVHRGAVAAWGRDERRS